MKLLFSFLLGFTVSLYGQSSSIIGQWSNCGSYNLNSSSITLYKTLNDTCDNYGEACPHSMWEFFKDSVQTVEISEGNACKKKLMIAAFSKSIKCRWVVDEKNKKLYIACGSDKYTFEIRVLNPSHLILLRK